MVPGSARMLMGSQLCLWQPDSFAIQSHIINGSQTSPSRGGVAVCRLIGLIVSTAPMGIDDLLLHLISS